MNRRQFLGTGLSAGLSGLAGRGVPAHSVSKPLRLNANENPLGLAPSARAALEEGISEANRYPFTSHHELLEQVARLHEVSGKSVILGNGSSELLRLAVQRFAGSTGRIVTADPTYEAVAGQAANTPLEVHRVPLTSDHQHDLVAMRKLTEGTEGVSLVYICNPNNPTATLTSVDSIGRWIEEAPPNVHFLVDEAYFHFVEDPSYRSLTGLAVRNSNLLVVRTFSKVYALAGLRIGYAVGHPDSIARLDSMTRLNLNCLALLAASASLKDSAFLEQSLASNFEGKRVLQSVLRELGIPSLPSHANFLMFKLSGRLNEFRQRMEGEGILVGRPFPPMDGYCRLSIGLPEEMAHAASTLRSFRERNWI